MSVAVETIAVGAAVAASLGAVARTSTHRSIHVLGLPFLLVGWLGLLAALAPSSVHRLWFPLGAATLIGLGLGLLLAGRLRGQEQWLLAAGAAVLTVRLPVPTGDGVAMLLAPLYVVIGVGALVLLRSELAMIPTSGPRLPDRGGSTRLLDIGAAAIPVLASLSLIWSIDRPASVQVLGLFLVPFILLYALVRAWLSVGVQLRPAAFVLVASALLAALIGLAQAATRTVWWNPKVIDANRFRADFRTNSLFWDPNIYGRALVVAILAIVGWLLVTRAGRGQLAAAIAALAVLVGALWNTYSQSSWAALATALVLLAVLTLPARMRRWVSFVIIIGVLVAMPVAFERLAGDDASGRQDVVRTGLALAAERPLVGYGIGTFETAARDRARKQGDRTPRLVASHTTPITVIAELGVLGAFAWLLLITSAMAAVLARWRRSAGPSTAVIPGWPIAPVAWASAVFAAIMAHSLLYAGFFEDATM
ncbi:MAG: O-antigen ligase family protein, partial [Gaiellales bacterium]